MTTIPACPPIPTLDELLHSGNFVEVNVNELVKGEFVLYRYGNNVRCIEVLDTVGPSGYLRIRYYDRPQNSLKKTLLKSNRVQFYRIGDRKNFNDITKEMEELIHNYPEENQNLTLGETIFANKGLSDNIGKFLGPPPSGKGGRRKTRARKNKRKSTRRIQRKYKR